MGMGLFTIIFCRVWWIWNLESHRYCCSAVAFTYTLKSGKELVRFFLICASLFAWDEQKEPKRPK